MLVVFDSAVGSGAVWVSFVREEAFGRVVNRRSEWNARLEKLAKKHVHNSNDSHKYAQLPLRRCARPLSQRFESDHRLKHQASSWFACMVSCSTQACTKMWQAPRRFDVIRARRVVHQTRMWETCGFIVKSGSAAEFVKRKHMHKLIEHLVPSASVSYWGYCALEHQTNKIKHIEKITSFHYTRCERLRHIKSPH